MGEMVELRVFFVVVVVPISGPGGSLTGKDTQMKISQGQVILRYSFHFFRFES